MDFAARKSTVFGQKSTEKHSKRGKRPLLLSLGRRCRRFEPCHSDQKSRKERLVLSFLFFRLKFTDLNLLKRIALECFAQARQRDPARRGAKPGSDPCHSNHMKIIRTFSYLESRSDYLFYSNMELKKLITLIHVAELGSFIRAAVSYSKKDPLTFRRRWGDHSYQLVVS